MKNLAGNKDADLQIRLELEEAGIPECPGKSDGEVPATLTGRLEGWTFTRAWYYWVAEAETSEGLPIRVATELHKRQYPAGSPAPNNPRGTAAPRIFGEVVRVEGHAGCPSPRSYVKKGTVDLYHIDTQPGLNEFVRTVLLHNAKR